MWEGGDTSWFGVEGYFSHLKCVEIGMVINAGLREKGDILEALVVLDDMMKVGVTFAADVFEGFGVELKLGRVLGAAFGVDLAVFDDRFEPGKVFIVVRDDYFKVQMVPRYG